MTEQKNHRVIVTGHGAPEVLVVAQEDLPQPGAGEARVQVHAAGVSAFDLIYRRWRWLPGRPPVPFALGEDIVGVVDKVGPGTTSVELGQMVAAGTWGLGVGGGYTEFICLPEEELVPVPAGVDPAEAVCLVVNYLTAYQHLHEYGKVRHGERALIHGAAGGVGSALVQLGRVAGLEMYGTASGHHHEFVAALGATPIDYKTEDFVDRIHQLTGNGVDIVLDPIGGGGHLWRSYRALRPGGRLVWVGSAAVDTKGLRVGPLSMLMVALLKRRPGDKSVPSCPTLDQYIDDHPGWFRPKLATLLDQLAAGELEPVVAERIPLKKAAEAHRLLERGGQTGKIVLVTDVY